MGKHEDKEKEEQERKQQGNGHRPGPLPPKEPGGKHEKKDGK